MNAWNAQATVKIGVLNDIHYDPYYDNTAAVAEQCRENSPLEMSSFQMSPGPSPYGHFGCDSPMSLIDIVMNKVKNLEPDLNILLISGDFLGHGFSVNVGRPDHYQLLKESFETVLIALSNHFPNTIILPAIGNNDIKYHYRAPTQNDDAPDYYSFLSDIMLNKISGNAGLDKNTINKTFLKAGYYRFDVSDRMSIISFNSLYYNSGNPSTEIDIKNEQMDWLESQLKNSEPNRKFIIYFHIYPGVYEAYRQQFFWEDGYTDRFVGICQDNADSIAMLLGAHTHFGDIRVHQVINEGASKQSIFDYLNSFIDPEVTPKISRQDAKFALLVTPSITPIFLNNPGATLFEVDNEIVQNVRYVFLQLYRFPQTEEEAVFEIVSFKNEFGIDQFSASSAQDFLDRVEDSSYLFYFKLLPFKVGYFGLLKTVAWAIFEQLGSISIWSHSEYMCMSRHMTKAEFTKCMGQ